jgi:HEAT repeat protein
MSRMGGGRGKRVAMAIGGLGIAVLILGTVASWKWIAETWWLYRLDSTEERAQLEAAERLGDLRSRRAIPKLVLFYQKKSADSVEIPPVFFRIGPEAVAVIVKSLPENNGRYYSQTPEEFEVLLACLEDRDPAVRLRVLRRLLLDFGGPRLRATLDRIQIVREKDPFLPARIAAANLLLRYRPSIETVRSALLVAFSPGDGDLSDEAAGLSGWIDPRVVSLCAPGPDLERIIPGLIRTMKKAQPGDDWAFKALSSLGPSAREAVPALVEMIEGENPTLVEPVIHCLGAIGPVARPAVPAFFNLVRRFDSRFDIDILDALTGIGEDPQLAADLLGILNDKKESSPVRELAILGVARAGPRNPAVSSALLGILADSSRSDDHRAAALALGRMGFPQAVPVLMKWLAFDNFSVQPPAARALGEIGPAAREAAPELARLLAKETSKNYEAAQFALALLRIAGDAKSALPLAEEFTGRGQFIPHETVEAIETLGALGPAASEVAPVLIARLGEPEVSRAAAEALRKIGKSSVPGLVQTLTSEDWYLRLKAVEVLGALGPEAVEALPALEALAGDQDQQVDVSRAAGAALKKIQRSGTERPLRSSALPQPPNRSEAY